MKGTNYLIWFRRLLVLGAVVAAGVMTTTAGAVGRPPDVQDTANALSTSDVNSPPDVQDFATAVHQSTAGVIADGLRLQGEAQVYQQLQNIPDVFERYAAVHPYGQGVPGSSSTIVSRPPDVSDAAQSAQSGSSDETFVTRPPDVTDTALAVGTESSSTSDGFNWGDWEIGIGMGAGLVLILCGLFIIGRQLKHRGVQTA
jgi:hypothetical protein